MQVLVEKMCFLRYGSEVLYTLPVRLMVGHLPLEQGIGVRVPDRQLTNEVRKLTGRDEKGSLGDFRGSFP